MRARLASLCTFPSCTPQKWQPLQHQQPAVPVSESQILALQALGTCCGRIAGPLPPDGAAAVLAALCTALTRCCGSGILLSEDAPHSRLYATLLRCLNAAVLESKKAWLPQSTAIIDALRRVLQYGVPRESRGPSHVAPSLPGGPGKATPGIAARPSSAVNGLRMQGEYRGRCMWLVDL